MGEGGSEQAYRQKIVRSLCVTEDGMIWQEVGTSQIMMVRGIVLL